jgi:hypothetical protein
MFHRFSTWWRALSVVLLSLAAVTWPSAAHAGTTPSFTVLHQSAVARLSPKGDSRFNVTLGIKNSSTKPLVQVSIYPRIIERSELSPIFSGFGASGSVMSRTGNFGLDCVARGKATFTVSMFAKSIGRTSSNCQSRPARLRLACASGQCDGVYPLSYSVTINGVTTTKWSLLAVEVARVVRPLHVDLVSALDPSSLRRTGSVTAVLKALAQHPTLPLTLTADYRTLAAIEQSTTSEAAACRAALNQAVASPLHRVIAAPPSDIDFGGLASNGFPSQVAQQVSLSTQLLRSVTGRYADTTVLLSGSPTLAAIKALANAHISDVIVPDTSLNPSPSTTLNWGAPFHFAGAMSVTALSTDDPLEQLATNDAIEPGRRATLTLATLAFLHFEAPNAPAIRTVVLLLPVTRMKSSYVNDLLNGFSGNPFVVAASLTPSFNSSLVATNGAPATRTLVNTASSSAWSSHNVSSLRTLIGQVNSFNQAVSSPEVTDALSVAVARAEMIGDPLVREAALANASAALNAQLNKFSVDQSSITLTGPGTALPITLLSRANYAVTAVVHLITDRLDFPRGSSVTVELDSSTKSLRVPTSNHRGSDLTLQVIVTTPNGQLVLARTAIQVRIAGNSVVGYLLTLASLVVLAYWWVRTYRRKSKGRHAR